MSKITLLLVLSLAVLVSACGVNASGSNLPGPTVTDEIRIPAPDAPAVRLTLEFGVGELSLSPGAEDGLVSAHRRLQPPRLQAGHRNGWAAMCFCVRAKRTGTPLWASTA